MAKKGSAASRKRKSKEDVKASSPPAAQKQKTAAASSDDAASVSKLAAQIITADADDLSRWIDDGTVETRLWPYFVHAVTNNNNDNNSSSSDNKNEEEPSVEAAYAIVLLTNHERSDGGGRGERLSYVVDTADTDAPSVRARAFALLLKCIFTYQRIHCHRDSSAASARSSSHQYVISTQIVQFLITSYSSMELRPKSLADNAASTSSDAVLAGPLVDLSGVRLWHFVPSRKRYLEMRRDGMLKNRYGWFVSRSRESGVDVVDVGFLPEVVRGVLDAVLEEDAGGKNKDDDNDGNNDNALTNSARRMYISKCLELIIDLLSYPQTRTHVGPYIASHQLAVLLGLSKLYRDASFVLFRQQVDMIIDSERTEAISTSNDEMSNLPYQDVASRSVHQRAHTLQKLLHRHHPRETSEVVFAGVGRVTDPSWLREKMGYWKEDTLYDVCYRSRLVDDDEDTMVSSLGSTARLAERLGCQRRELLSSILLYHHSARKNDAVLLSSTPLYPTETLLWDPYSVPPGNYYGNGHSPSRIMESLSLPKLNARFLSASDYLLRNFRLFRLESAYEIRSDIVDVVKRMMPTRKADGYVNNSNYYENVHETGNGGDDLFGKTQFNGWARMGLELKSNREEKQGLRIIRVDPPKLGERVPASVIAEVVIDLYHCATSLISEWSEIGEFDNLFLVSVDASKMSGAPAPMIEGRDRRVPDEEDFTFPQRQGIQAVRGCMVLEVRDEAGVVLSDPALAYEEGGRPEPKGKRRYLRVALDPAQYAADATGNGSSLGIDVYDTFNLLVRRHGRENNFKATLETIRGLMKGGSMSMYRSIPSWLMPVILGYGGDPSAATFTSKKMIAFASKTAGVNSPNAALDYGDTFIDNTHLRDSFPNCYVTVDGKDIGTAVNEEDRRKYRLKVIDKGSDKIEIEVSTYPFPPRYNGNPIRFTPVQVKAIRSGLSPGLTTIVGPPGSGKTG